jgi:hypothetical protein
MRPELHTAGLQIKNHYARVEGNKMAKITEI